MTFTTSQVCILHCLSVSKATLESIFPHQILFRDTTVDSPFNGLGKLNAKRQHCQLRCPVPRYIPLADPKRTPRAVASRIGDFPVGAGH